MGHLGCGPFNRQKNANDSTETDNLGQDVPKNDLYRKIQNQCARIFDTNDSLDVCIRQVKKLATGSDDCSEPLVTLFLTENGKLGAPQTTSEASFFKRLEYIQGWPLFGAITGGLIGNIDAQGRCVEKVLKIIDRINAKTGVKSSEHETLAKALSALSNKTDCRIFGHQIHARTYIKTIPKAVESVVGNFDSESYNAYGLVGWLHPFDPGPPEKPGTQDIYRRLNEALRQLDAALKDKFEDTYASPSSFTLQGIIEALVKVPATNS